MHDGSRIERARAKLEALERTIEEIEALKVIYNEDDDFGSNNSESRSSSCSSSSSSSFTVLSLDELQQAQRMVEEFHINEENATKTYAGGEGVINIPTLTVQLVLSITDSYESEGAVSGTGATIHFTLPPGYLLSNEFDDNQIHNPIPAIVSVVSLGTGSGSTSTSTSFSRSKRNELSTELNTKAMEFAESSCEAIMLLIQELQDAVLRMKEEEEEQEGPYPDSMKNQTTATTSHHPSSTEAEADTTTTSPFSRRWIWVHHITKNSRINDIVHEAQDLSLSGYLKSGYPGVCVIEGPSTNCDEFVQWIKGNKSRPGGFGRNWGHHVRGQIDYNYKDTRNRAHNHTHSGDVDGDGDGDEREASTSEQRGFVNEFRHVGEDLAELSGSCRDVGKWMEDEFLTYVMQH